MGMETELGIAQDVVINHELKQAGAAYDARAEEIELRMMTKELIAAQVRSEGHAAMALAAAAATAKNQATCLQVQAVKDEWQLARVKLQQYEEAQEIVVEATAQTEAESAKLEALQAELHKEDQLIKHA